MASLTAVSFHSAVVRFEGLVGFRGDEVAARPRIERMHTYNIHIVPLAEINRIEHFHSVMYQLYLIDAWVSTKVNSLEAARLLNRA